MFDKLFGRWKRNESPAAEDAFAEFTPGLLDRLRTQTSGNERRELLTAIRAGRGGEWTTEKLAPLLRKLGPRLFVEMHDAMGRAGIPFEREDWRTLAQMVEPNPLVAWLSIYRLREMESEDIFGAHAEFLREQHEPWLRSMLAEQLMEATFANPVAAFLLLADVEGLNDVAGALAHDDATMREAAVEALISLGEPAFAAVYEMLGASRADTRIAAAEVLRRSPSERSISSLEQALKKDRSKKARAAIQEALHECLKLRLPDFSQLGMEDVERLNDMLTADPTTLPAEVQKADLPAVRWSDGTEASNGTRTWVLARLIALGPDDEDADLRKIVGLLDEETRGALLSSLREQYPEEADERRIGWLLFAVGLLGDDTEASRLGAGLDEIARRGSSVQAFRRVRVLRDLGTPSAIGWLDQWASEAKSHGLRSRAAHALRELAAEASTSVDDLVEEAVPDTRFMPRRLERSMASARRWPLQAWRERYVDDPVRWTQSRAIVWMAFFDDRRVAFRIAEDRTFSDVDDETVELPGDALIGIAHPVYLSRTDRGQWEEILADYELVSPFSQFRREVFVSVGEGRQDATIADFGDRPLAVNAIRYGLERTDWLRGGADDGWVSAYFKPVPTVRMTMVMRLTPGFEIGDPEWAGEQRLEVFCIEGVHFDEPGEAKRVPKGDVPLEVYSETRRELAALYS